MTSRRTGHVVRLLILAAAAATATVIVAPRPAAAEVTPAQVSASDVVIDVDASVSPGDQQRLEQAARDLRAKGVPTKFVVVGQRPVNPPATARSLRLAIGFNGNVLVLSQSPRSLGIASGVRAATIQKVFEAGVPKLQADPVGGAILVGNNLATKLNGSIDHSMSPVDWLIDIAFLLAVGLGVFALIRWWRRRPAVSRGSTVGPGRAQGGFAKGILGGLIGGAVAAVVAEHSSGDDDSGSDSSGGGSSGGDYGPGDSSGGGDF